MNKMRRDFRERNENEPAFVHSRMRQRQKSVVADDIAEKQQIQIDRARFFQKFIACAREDIRS